MSRDRTLAPSPGGEARRQHIGHARRFDDPLVAHLGVRGVDEAIAVGVATQAPESHARGVHPAGRGRGPLSRRGRTQVLHLHVDDADAMEPCAHHGGPLGLEARVRGRAVTLVQISEGVTDQRAYPIRASLPEAALNCPDIRRALDAARGPGEEMTIWCGPDDRSGCPFITHRRRSS